MPATIIVHGETVAHTLIGADGARSLVVLRPEGGVVARIGIPARGPVSADRAGRVLLPDGRLVDLTAKAPKATRPKVALPGATLDPGGEAALLYAPPARPYSAPKKKTPLAGVLRVSLADGSAEVLWAPQPERRWCYVEDPDAP